MLRRQRHGGGTNHKVDSDDSDDVERSAAAASPITHVRHLLERSHSSPRRHQSHPTLVGPPLLRRRPRSVSRRDALRLLTAAAVCTILAWSSGVLARLTVYLLGDGYSASGGLLGDAVDRYLAAAYAARLERRRDATLPYPDVTVKATRRTERAHYSAYLEAILHRHANASSSSPGARAVVAVPAADVERRRPPGSSRSSRVDISGASSLLLASARVNSTAGDLRAEGCPANWLCQRCLRTAWAGSYAACRAVCRQCYIRILSTLPRWSSSKDDLLRVVLVRDGPPPDGGARRIPRAVHQAWRAFPRALDYPELARLRAAWRAAPGYEYHFYAPPQQKAFVREHYPAVVGTAYDMIGDEQNRRDLFQWLVLFRLGGVFAAVDLMLETNLDALIEPGTSFVAARGKDPLLPNCLWSGFVAAEPGHPVLAAAIAYALRAALTGSADGSTPERLVLQHAAHCSGGGIGAAAETLPLWKLRATEQADQYAYGGCALGVAVNSVWHSKSPLADFDVLGKHPSVSTGGGDLLILLVGSDGVDFFLIGDAHAHSHLLLSNLLFFCRFVLSSGGLDESR